MPRQCNHASTLKFAPHPLIGFTKNYRHTPLAQLVGGILQSLQAGHPVTLDRIDTIADSLSAPKAMPLTFAVAQAKVDQMVQVTDDQLRAGMRAYFDALRLVAEPACAAALAAICGPLRAQMAGKRIGIIACGSNISLPRYQALLG